MFFLFDFFLFLWIHNVGPCRDAFSTRPDASCVLYDDELCDGTEGEKELTGGESVESVTDFDVESVSVKKGCQLTIYTGDILI